MKRYFAYTRVSTVRQGETGSSLAEQKSAITLYASRQGLPIAGWYEEMETAAKQGRTQFNQMLAELNRGRADGLLIHKIDRSARNLKDWARLGELIDRGVEVHFAHESLDLQSRGGRLAADIQAVVASDYVRNLRQEVRKGFYGRLKQGFYPLPAPVGYVDQGKAKAKTIDPMKGPLVREMFELYATGRYSQGTLAEEMARRGLRSRSGGALGATSIALVLHNPFYVGIIRLSRTGETFEGNHPALISKGTFDRVQAVMAGRVFPHILKHGFAYRRLIRCAACGRSLIGERQKGHVYYRCHTSTCSGTSVRETAVDDGLRALVDRLQFSKEDMRDLRDMAMKAGEDQERAERERRSSVERALGLCEARLNRLTDAFLDGAVDRETFEGRKAALFDERASLREAHTRPPAPDPAAELLEIVELAKEAQLGLISPIPEEKRRTVEILTSNLVLSGKELSIRPRNAFEKVISMRPVQ